MRDGLAIAFAFDPMDRRTFLARSAVGSGALVLAGCGGAAVRRELDVGEAREMLARLERGLSRVRNVPNDVVERAMAGHRNPRLAGHIFRLGLEALVVVDVARSLPQGGEVPAPLAERLAPELPLLDQYAGTYHALLASIPPSGRRELSTKVRAHPNVAMDIAGWIDGHAREIGVTTESRAKLRSEAAGLTTRMRRQSTNAVIDDCLGKVERVLARGGAAVSEERARTTQAMIGAIWSEAHKGLGDKLAAPSGSSVGRRASSTAVEEDREWWFATRSTRTLWSARWASPGDQELMIGGILMPFGLATCGLLLIAGLIVMIAGAVQNSEWDGSPRHHGA